MTVLQKLIKNIDDNWEPKEDKIVDMIRSWAVADLPAEEQQVRDALIFGVKANGKMEDILKSCETYITQLKQP